MMPAMTRGDSELPINGMRITLGRFSGSGEEGNLGKGRLPSTSDSPCRPRRSLNSALSGTSCLVGVALLGISAVALVALRAHQHPPEHAGVGLMHGLAPQERDVAQRDIVRKVVEIHRLWSDDPAASSNYSLATAAANANATLSDSRATLDLAGAGTNASKLNVSTPYRWLIQNLLGITPQSRPAVTLQRYGTTVARIVAFDRWQHRVALDVPPSSPTMAALSFTGMVLRPAGGLDVIGMLALFPAAKAYWILSETPLGRTDYHFWGHAEMRARRGQVHQDLHDFVGPFGWLPSATELQRSGKHRPSDVGMFPTLLGVMTLGGYVLLSVDVDVDKSTRSPDGIVIPTHCLVFGRLGSPEEPPRVLYYTAMERDSLAVQSVSDKLSAHLLQNRLSLAAHLVGAEYGFLGETAQPLRQLVTAVASVVVQDDSGLPFHTLQTSFDSIDSWGDYIGPLHLAFIDAAAVTDVVQLGLLEYFRTVRALGEVGELPLGDTGFERWDIRPEMNSHSHGEIKTSQGDAHQPMRRQTQCMLVATQDQAVALR